MVPSNSIGVLDQPVVGIVDRKTSLFVEGEILRELLVLRVPEKEVGNVR